MTSIVISGSGLYTPPFAVSNEELVAAFDKARATLEGRGRLLIRQSGTEPMIRVMVESDDEIECDVMANDLADKIKAVLG